jgi:tRNA threonylcarbamoyladenosine biosynthesis protein TsaE
VSSQLQAVTRSAGETVSLAERVGALLRAGDLVVLAGALGTGKTTFARGIAGALGVTEPVISPTFTIVRRYVGRLPLAHVDVYRLDTLQELHDVGFDELLDDRTVTLVEWGDVVAPALPRERLEVLLEANGPGDDDRIVTLDAHGPAWLARCDALAAVTGDSAAAAAGGQ